MHGVCRAGLVCTVTLPTDVAQHAHPNAGPARNCRLLEVRVVMALGGEVRRGPKIDPAENRSINLLEEVCIVSMMRWDPFRELESIREAMDRAFEEPLWSAIRRPAEFEAVHTIPIDMYETDNDIFVRALVPGVKPDDISISVSGNLLSIRAERRLEENVKRENYFRREIGAGRFYRELTLPMPVNADQCEAT